MRNDRGYYHSFKSVSESVPEWAKGCSKCSHGLVDAPPLTRADTVLMERMAQMLLGMLQFCDCKAGVAQEKNLTQRRFALVNEALEDPRMQEQARRKSHVDIDNAMHAVVAAMEEAPAPSMHLQEEEAK